MSKKGSVNCRVPKDIAKILERKLPQYESAVRWRLVWDTSAMKVDEFLGKPIKFKRKK